MRGTMHLVPTDDFAWLSSIYSERIAMWSRRRLALLGVEAKVVDRAMKAVAKALSAGAPLPRSDVMEVAGRTGFEVSTQTRTHLTILLCTEGAACIGSDIGRETTLVASAEWVGELRLRPREAALIELARRYVLAFAPVTDRDFAYWGGLSLGDARVGLEGARDAIHRLRIDGADYLVPKDFAGRVPSSPIVRLLGAFDTYLMGYVSRRHAVDAANEKLILPGGGVLRPTICVDGRFVGTWSQKRTGRNVQITLEPFWKLDDSWLDAITGEIRDIGRFENAEAALA